VLGTLGGQSHHDPGEDAPFAAALEPMARSRSPPALPAVVKGFRRAVFLRRVTPAQPVAIDENYAAEDTAIIDAGLARSSGKQSPGLFSDLPHLGKERLRTFHLGVNQPIKIAHRSDLLAEPEAPQMPEINEAGAPRQSAFVPRALSGSEGRLWRLWG
jgi:hypothetical protein